MPTKQFYWISKTKLLQSVLWCWHSRDGLVAGETRKWVQETK